MFFYLSKIITFLIDPAFLILLFCFICLIKSKWKFPARFLVILSFLSIYLISTRFFANNAFFQLEHLEEPSRMEQHYDVVIVLSGMVNLSLSSNGKIEFSGAVDRILAGISMLKQGMANYLIISGGEGSLVRLNRPESQILKEFALKQGLQENQIIVETRSRNTHENAIQTAELIKKYGFNKLLLITSAFHMYRARGCFRKAGIEADIYPVDYYTGRINSEFSDFLPSSDALSLMSLLIHEVVGIVVYGLTGRAKYS